MASVISINFGKGLGELAATRGDGNDLRSHLVGLVTDIASIRTAIVAEAAYADARAAIIAAAVEVSFE